MTTRGFTNTSHPPTADRMRHDISRGKAGDKVDHPDPAVAPLGTDDEAAGMAPSLEERRIAAANAPSEPRETRAVDAGSVYVAIVIGIVAVVLAAALAFG
jgi:hypothetical protein